MDEEQDDVELLIEITDLAEHGRVGSRPRRAHRYLILIDEVEHVVHQHVMTATAILDLVGKGPDEWVLELVLHGDERERCEPNDVVTLHERGIKAFETVKRHHHHHHHHPQPYPSPPPPVPPPVRWTRRRPCTSPSC